MNAHPATLLTAALYTAASGVYAALPAVTGYKIAVHGIAFTVDGATDVTFLRGTTALSGAFQLTAAGSSLFFPPSDEPYYTCNLSEAFNISQTNAQQLRGTIWYVIEP